MGCVAVLIAGCAGPSEVGSSPTEPEADPTGIPWQLASGTIDDAAVTLVEGFPITLTFSADGASGTAACNGYGATVSMSDHEIAFSEMMWSAMGCSPSEVMDSETRYLEALPRVDAYSGSEDRLTLTGEGVELSFVALPPVPIADLTGTVWVLTSLVDGDSVSSVSGDPATLELYTDGSMLGSTGCRTLHGRYVVAGAEVIISEMAAEGECPPELQEQDSHVVSVLGDGFTAAVSRHELTLTSTGGQGLVYTADG